MGPGAVPCTVGAVAQGTYYACRLKAAGVKLVVCLQQDTDLVRTLPMSPLSTHSHSSNSNAQSNMDTAVAPELYVHNRFQCILLLRPSPQHHTSRLLQAYFDLDIEPIQERAKEVDLRHVRLRINDMDPLNLRLRLPEVIKSMHQEVQSTPAGITYVHCTAGTPYPCSARFLLSTCFQN